MPKQPADTLQVPKAKPKKSKGTKKSANSEAAPDANDRSGISKIAISTKEDAIMDDGDDTPKKKNGTKATTPRMGAKAASPKKGAKAFTPEKKDAEAAVPEKDSEAGVPKAKAKKPPVGDGFLPYAPRLKMPTSNPFWGLKPISGDPRPHPDQPSARASNGQVNPPLWENRGYRYKRGARYVKHHYNVEPKNIATLPQNRDQEDLLEVPVIDMRAKCKNGTQKKAQDLEPKRVPESYCYKKRPKDWNCKQSIKALNDRRYQGIDRMTMDAPWSLIEQEYLAHLIRENPDGSIWELTELHNDRFKDQDYKENVGFAEGDLSTGRTVESVRYQYTAYKPFYDRGKVPLVRWRGDKSLEGVKLAQYVKKKFGQPSKAEERAHDLARSGNEDSDDDDDGDDGDEKPKKHSPKGKKKTPETVEESDDEDESDAFDPPSDRKRHAPDESQDDERPIKKSKTRNANPFSGQSKLDDEGEELLMLAGAYDHTEEDEGMTDDQDSGAEGQADSDIHATRDIEMDENYDDEE